MVEEVERATAAPAESVEAATADTVREVAPATADASNEDVGAAYAASAESVEPALTYEESQKIKQQKSKMELEMKKTSTTSSNNNNDLSIENIRERQGIEYESIAAVLHGASPKNCLQILLPCIYDERDFVSFGEVKKYIIIVDGTCMVYNESTDQQPLYAIDLSTVYPIIEDRFNPDPESATISPIPDGGKNLPPEGYVTVNLKYKTTKKQAYQITVDTTEDRSLEKRFIDAIEIACKKVRPDAVDAEPITEKTTSKV